jgi:hypothetical protein
MSPLITLHNVATGEIKEREMNVKELAQLEADKVESEQQKAEAEAKATQKAALLNRLGITEAEAKLLLA